MEELIRFRWLNDQLNHDEFTHFVSEFIETVFSTSNGRRLFNKMIFKGFENSPEEIIPFTNITTKIINSRESKQNQQEMNSFDKLDNFPSDLILKCSAFLETTDYVHFGHSNRKIYKSIYSPSSKIQTLSRNAFKKYPQTLNMKRFRNIKNLSIDIKHFNNNLSCSNQSIWKTENKLNTLEIDGCNEYDIIEFIKKKKMDLINITKLSMNEIELETIPFYEAISHFTNIQCLILYDTNSAMDHNINDENISNIIGAVPNLKQFSYSNDCNLAPLIVTAFNDKLEALALSGCSDCNISSSITFPKLRELYLLCPDDEQLSIFDRIKNLKTARLEIIIYDDEFENIVKQFINKVIDEQLSLEHLKFDINSELFDFTISELESALFSSRNNGRKSKSLFIEFNIVHLEGFMDAMCLSVTSFVRLMTKQLKLDDFGIKIKMNKNASGDKKFDKNSMNMKKWLNELETMKETYFVQYGFTKNKFYESFTFSISNKNYKMNTNNLFTSFYSHI